MKRTNLTIYFPKDILEKIKIEAVREGVHLSDLITAFTMHFIDHVFFDSARSKPKNDTKVFIYLTEEEKRKIKKAAAENKTTLSNLVFQAADYYLQNKHGIDLTSNGPRITVRFLPLKNATKELNKKPRLFPIT